MSESTESMDVCGLEGNANAPPPRKEINRFIGRALHYHVVPMKRDVADVKEIAFSIKETIDRHIEEDKIFFAKLSGVKYAIWAILGILAFMAPYMYQIMQAIELLGIRR